jgi:acetyl esterase/lipase
MSHIVAARTALVAAVTAAAMAIALPSEAAGAPDSRYGVTAGSSGERAASICDVRQLCGVAGELPHEVKAAAGWPARPARGTVIVLHGGGWRHDVGDPRLLAGMAADARRFRQRGFHTVNTSYRPGAAGYSDVRRVYREVGRRTHARPGLLGASAGGHLALVLASEERPAFAISMGGPTDLPTLPAPLVRGWAEDAFGRRGLLRWSPSRRRMRVPVLLAHNRGDRLVPVTQTRVVEEAEVALLDGLPRPRPRPGLRAWSGHGTVSTESLSRYHKVEAGFVDRQIRP